MKIKCDYCGNYLSDTDEKCPNCMAPNTHLKRVGNELPQTIEELRIWYQEHNLPPEDVTRFFIGKNIQSARAFGIYYDERTGNYVVYKNKDTGERAVRYEGKDEAYAVNELYLKLKEEIMHQKSLNANRAKSNIDFEKERAKSNKRLQRSLMFATIFPIIIVLATLIPVGVMLFGLTTHRHGGYYEYNKEPYYLYSSCYISDGDCEWYRYNTNTDQWSVAGKFREKKAEYVGEEWNNYKGIEIKNELREQDWFKEIHPPVPESGYYTVDGKTYYYFHGWYVYDSSWGRSEAPNHDVELNPNNYYDQTRTYDDPYDFSDTDYYSNYYVSNSSSDYDSSWSSSSNDSSWDSGSSWDSSDSWDSGSTDWGSDW